MTTFPINRPRQVADLAPAGERVEVVATAGEREALASLFGVLAVENLSADLTLRPWRSVGVAVDGEVVGTVRQTCVVTLDPVDQPVRETVSVRLMPGTLDVRAMPDGRERVVDVDPEGEDPPDTFENGRIDLGAIAAEHFALGIDPYPRKPGVAFDPDAAGVAPGEAAPDERPASPFPALADLKRRGGA